MLFYKRIKRIKDQFIAENSPVEIILIEMAPGDNQFNVLYVNKLKAKAFNKEDKEIINKKCYEVFEPDRQYENLVNGHCDKCPSLRAYDNPKKLIREEWNFIHPVKNEMRCASITAKRLPNSTQVIEIVRDCTIRKRVFELSLKLIITKQYKEVEELFISGFLQEMYFERCRFYLRKQDENKLDIKSFTRAIQSEKAKYMRNIIYEPTEDIKTLTIDSLPEELMFDDLNYNPHLFYISDFINDDLIEKLKLSKYSYELNSSQCTNINELNKQKYPIWLEFPLVSKNRILGKISVDIDIEKISNIFCYIDDYDIEIIGIFSNFISQIWDNIKLFDLTILGNIDEIVLTIKGKNIYSILSKILSHGIDFLGVNEGYIALINNETTVKLISKHGDKIEGIPINTSLCGEVIKKYLSEKKDVPTVYNNIPQDISNKYYEINTMVNVKSCISIL